jgi:predicted nucleotidyltransferase
MITKSIKNKIKDFFFLNPTLKLRVRQIEREVKVPLPSVIRYTKELEKERILKSFEIANITVFFAERASGQFLLEKKLFNILQLFSSGLVKYIVEILSNPIVIVFGSYSKGEDIEKSDIDIYIETDSKKDLKLFNFEKLLQRKIQVFSYKKIKDIKNKELSNNIINGITLNGFLEVFK